VEIVQTDILTAAPLKLMLSWGFFSFVVKLKEAAYQTTNALILDNRQVYQNSFYFGRRQSLIEVDLYKT